jgi:hypothetical protein
VLPAAGARREPGLAIATLVLWMLNAGVGVTLLSSGNAARRRAADPARAAGTPARIPAVPLTEDGKPPRVPPAKVVAPPGEHPLLQFSHPALALIGLGFWFAFALIHYRTFGWISIGVLVVTIGAGLGWLARNGLTARRRPASARAFPPRLIVLHGLAATALIALTLLTALSVAHG